MRGLRTTWSSLSREQRLVAIAALGLLFAMFLPWYSTSFPVKVGKTGIRQAAGVDSKSAIGAFTFVEAAVLLVAISVLLLLKARADGKAFHLPGGDGTIITLAGGWTCVLIIWRLFDKPHLGGAVVGLKWGIFAALAVAGMLTYAGLRLRAAHQLEPPLPPDEPVRTTEPRADVHIPDDRPHLARTTVLRRDRPDESQTVAIPRRDDTSDTVAIPRRDDTSETVAIPQPQDPPEPPPLPPRRRVAENWDEPPPPAPRQPRQGDVPPP
jgi:hypothetical protein